MSSLLGKEVLATGNLIRTKAAGGEDLYVLKITNVEKTLKLRSSPVPTKPTGDYA